MWEILNVLRRIGRGENKAAIARVTSHSRTTIRRYVATAVELGWQAGIEEPTERLAVKVFERLQPVAGKSRPGEVERCLLPYRDRITEWLRPPAPPDNTEGRDAPYYPDSRLPCPPPPRPGAHRPGPGEPESAPADHLSSVTQYSPGVVIESSLPPA